MMHVLGFDLRDVIGTSDNGSKREGGMMREVWGYKERRLQRERKVFEVLLPTWRANSGTVFWMQGYEF